MGNSILYNTARSIALAVDYVVHGPYDGRFITKEADKTLRINAEVYVRVDDAVFCIEDDVDLTESDLDEGSAFDGSATYYVYACHPVSGSAPAFKISKNATYPTGWTANTSRKIGGFQTDGSGNVDESSIWDLRTVDITISGVTDDMVPAHEISASKVKFSQYFQRGMGTFNGQAGVGIPITDVGTTDYHVTVTPRAQSGFIGEISVESRAANAFVVKNTGSDKATQFDWILNVGY